MRLLFLFLSILSEHLQALITETTESATTATAPIATSVPPTSITQGISVHHDFICHMSSMEIFMPVSVVPNSKLWMKDPACVLTNNGTHHVITFSYDQCGTTVEYYTDVLNISTHITVHTDLQVSGPVVFGDDYVIPLFCQVPRHKELDGAFQAVTGNVPLQEVNDNTNIGFHLKEYTSADYTHEITSYPVQVSIHNELFIEVTLTDENIKNTTLGIKVNHCHATPSPDPHDNTSYALIKDSCPSTPAVHLQSSPDPGTFRFSVQAFHFSGGVNHNDVVYIHCDVSICPVNACNVHCGSSVLQRTKRRIREVSQIAKKRKIRAVSQTVRQRATLTSGPNIIVNDIL